MKKYLLAHDLGTSGNKATLYSTEGELVKSCVHSYDMLVSNNNWVEQRPELSASPQKSWYRTST